MKKISLLLALIIAQLSLGQDADTDTKKRANEVGIEFLGLIDGQTMISYERSFGKHWSGLIGAGPKSKEGLVNISGIDGPSIQTGDVFYTGFKILLEGRYYVSEHTNGRAIGFYFGFYTKFSDFNSDLVGTYTDSAGDQFNVNFDAGINVVSAGFMVGYKLPLSKRLAIDFLIAGPGAGNYSFSIQNKSDDLPESFFDDLNDALENISLLDLIEADFEFDRSKQRSSFTVPSFRYAISLKYNF
ncbi:DUF3575 domain-containing protein [Winogradskyella sp. DF17]|uniref:DUF3575 domain-containing protein n=1 Tax=Winogradskyella pelagia TaxID=2819984 RepID=A0ABS3T6U8_9FLAO|nr:DUF3575 domain-containing protein [Winogradskyella sp. DF17]MBO3117445.1 DUF3575 domain-containing protein [Winogradskyella sp. DF17]